MLIGLAEVTPEMVMVADVILEFIGAPKTGVKLKASGATSAGTELLALLAATLVTSAVIELLELLATTLAGLDGLPLFETGVAPPPPPHAPNNATQPNRPSNLNVP